MSQFNSWGTKLKLGGCVMLITQGLVVAYILERGARPVGTGWGHTKSFNPVNVKNGITQL